MKTKISLFLVVMLVLLGWSFPIRNTLSNEAKSSSSEIIKINTTFNQNKFSSPNIDSKYYHKYNNYFAARKPGCGAIGPDCSLVGQCTWYVYGRIQETGVIFNTDKILSSKKDINGTDCFVLTDRSGNQIFTDHAYKWDDIAVELGLKVDSNPEPGCIAVWDAGDAGHVAFVEDVVDGKILISESNMTSKYDNFLKSKPNYNNKTDVILCVGKQILYKEKNLNSEQVSKLSLFQILESQSLKPESGNGKSWYKLKGFDIYGNAIEGYVDLRRDDDVSTNITAICLEPDRPQFSQTNAKFIHFPKKVETTNEKVIIERHEKGLFGEVIIYGKIEGRRSEVVEVGIEDPVTMKSTPNELNKITVDAFGKFIYKTKTGTGSIKSGLYRFAFYLNPTNYTYYYASIDSRDSGDDQYEVLKGLPETGSYDKPNPLLDLISNIKNSAKAKISYLSSHKEEVFKSIVDNVIQAPINYCKEHTSSCFWAGVKVGAAIGICIWSGSAACLPAIKWATISTVKDVTKNKLMDVMKYLIENYIDMPDDIKQKTIFALESGKVAMSLLSFNDFNENIVTDIQKLIDLAQLIDGTCRFSYKHAFDPLKKIYVNSITATDKNGNNIVFAATFEDKNQNNVSKPSSPRNLKINYNGKDSANLNWEKPTVDGGSKILRYTIYRRNKTTGRNNQINVYTESYLDDEVVPNNEYCYNITAWNEKFESDLNQSNEVCKNMTSDCDFSIDCPNKDVTVKSTEKATFTISTKATNGGGFDISLDYYSAQFDTNKCFLSSETVKVGNSATLSVNTTNLTPNETYTLIINATGCSKKKSIVLSFKVIGSSKATVPNAPEITKLEQTIVNGKMAIKIEWSTPNDGGSQITKYNLELMKSINGSLTWVLLTSSNKNQYIHENVEAGKIYTYRVNAENSVGKSNYSQSKALQVKDESGPNIVVKAIEPLDGAIINSKIVFFSWECTTSSNLQGFFLQIGNDKNFVKGSWGNKIESKYRKANISFEKINISKDDYFWRIGVCQNPEKPDQVTAWSEVRSFRFVLDEPPPQDKCDFDIYSASYLLVADPKVNDFYSFAVNTKDNGGTNPAIVLSVESKDFSPGTVTLSKYTCWAGTTINATINVSRMSPGSTYSFAIVAKGCDNVVKRREYKLQIAGEKQKECNFSVSCDNAFVKAKTSDQYAYFFINTKDASGTKPTITFSASSSTLDSKVFTFLQSNSVVAGNQIKLRINVSELWRDQTHQIRISYTGCNKSDYTDVVLQVTYVKPEKPVQTGWPLISPKNNTILSESDVVDPSRITLSWNRPAGEFDYYKIEIYEDNIGGFTAYLCSEYGDANNTVYFRPYSDCSYMKFKPVFAKKYVWRVATIKVENNQKVPTYSQEMVFYTPVDPNRAVESPLASAYFNGQLLGVGATVKPYSKIVFKATAKDSSVDYFEVGYDGYVDGKNMSQIEVIAGGATKTGDVFSCEQSLYKLGEYNLYARFKRGNKTSEWSPFNGRCASCNPDIIVKEEIPAEKTQNFICTVYGRAGEKTGTPIITYPNVYVVLDMHSCSGSDVFYIKFEVRKDDPETGTINTQVSHPFWMGDPDSNGYYKISGTGGFHISTWDSNTGKYYIRFKAKRSSSDTETWFYFRNDMKISSNPDKSSPTFTIIPRPLNNTNPYIISKAGYTNWKEFLGVSSIISKIKNNLLNRFLFIKNLFTDWISYNKELIALNW